MVSVGERGLIGIGFTDASAKLGRQPGWEPGTFGYHGDDGRKYHARGSGEPYGPRFGTGDVVGCGIDWEAKEVFFTKNGLYLGAAFRSSSGPASGSGGGGANKATAAAAAAAASAAATAAAGALTPTTVTTTSLTSGLLYPTIGLHSRGERVTANFGAAPFRYDLEGAVSAARARARAAVEAEAAAAMASSSSSSSSSLSSTFNVCALCTSLVRDYLLMQGFQKTLRALDGTAAGGRDTPFSDPTEIAAEASLPSRAAARRALVSEGDVVGARRASEAAGAGGGGEVACDDDAAAAAAAALAAAAAEPEVALLLDGQELIESLRKGSSGKRSGKDCYDDNDDESYKEVEAALEKAQQSEAFARALSSYSSSSGGGGGGGGGGGSGGRNGGSDDGAPARSPPPPPSHSEFAHDVLALAAYPRPQDSPFSGLVSRQQRQAVADALNAALLFHTRRLIETTAEARAAATTTATAAADKGKTSSSAPSSSSSSWPTSKLERAVRQLVAAAAESHFAGGEAGEPFRLEELVPAGATEAAAEAAAPLPP